MCRCSSICPFELNSGLSDQEKRELRLAKGWVSVTYEEPIEDYGLRGLAGLLKQLPTLSKEERTKKATLLWEALIELEDRRGQGVFSGIYKWQYHQWRSATFDSSFIRSLNRVAWVPDADGNLQPASSVLFDSLKWRADPFLLSRIHFKKPIVEELAREVGIEPGVLDLLKKLGLTKTAELIARLNVDDSVVAAPNAAEAPSHESPSVVAAAPLGPTNGGDEPADERKTAHEEEGNPSGVPNVSKGQPLGIGEGDEQGQPDGNGDSAERQRGHSPSKSARKSGERRFVSYVEAHPEDANKGQDDPDGLSHIERLELETRAIDFIRSREPVLKAMPAGNPGFDLIETDANDEPERWVEVKAMTGSLEDRPVGLSSVQFNFARQHGEQYWLYVVEHADDPERARIVKIQNPAGRAGTFTYDKGWISVADIDSGTSVVSTSSSAE